jgi:hypothetical protein
MMASGMGVFDRWCFSMYWKRSPPSHICMGFPDKQCLLQEVAITHLHEDVTLLGLPVVLVRKHLDDERMIKRRMDFADRSHKPDQFSLLGPQAAERGTYVSLSEYRRSWGDNFARLISFMARIWKWEIRQVGLVSWISGNQPCRPCGAGPCIHRPDRPCPDVQALRTWHSCSNPC